MGGGAAAKVPLATVYQKHSSLLTRKRMYRGWHLTNARRLNILVQWRRLHQCCCALGVKPSSMSAVTITVLRWIACLSKISLFAGIAGVSRGTRKRENPSGAANQQGRSQTRDKELSKLWSKDDLVTCRKCNWHGKASDCPERKDLLRLGGNVTKGCPQCCCPLIVEEYGWVHTWRVIDEYAINHSRGPKIILFW